MCTYVLANQQNGFSHQNIGFSSNTQLQNRLGRKGEGVEQTKEENRGIQKSRYRVNLKEARSQVRVMSDVAVDLLLLLLFSLFSFSSFSFLSFSFYLIERG